MTTRIRSLSPLRFVTTQPGARAARRTALRSILCAILLSGLGGSLLACSGTEAETQTPDANASAPASADAGGSAPAPLTASDLFEQDAYWPNIVALTAPYTPAEGETPLKVGHRGALMRVEPSGRVRIAFGRHGNHEVPIEKTDLVERANAVRSGELHKVAPTFLAHFGAQFIEVVGSEVAPVPTPQIAHAQRFLLLFADPRATDFEREAKTLARLREAAPDLQLLFFPLGLAPEQTIVIRDALTRSGLLVPFAYPAAADVHTRSLMGSVPSSAQALLITPEGRILERGPIGASEWIGRLSPSGHATSPIRP